MPLPEFISRIRAAVAARRKTPGCDIVIIARTDAAQGYGLDEGLDRLKAAVKEGADGTTIFLRYPRRTTLTVLDASGFPRGCPKCRGSHENCSRTRANTCTRGVFEML